MKKRISLTLLFLIMSSSVALPKKFKELCFDRGVPIDVLLGLPGIDQLRDEFVQRHRKGELGFEKIPWCEPIDTAESAAGSSARPLTKVNPVTGKEKKYNSSTSVKAGKSRSIKTNEKNDGAVPRVHSPRSKTGEKTTKEFQLEKKQLPTQGKERWKIGINGETRNHQLFIDCRGHINTLIDTEIVARDHETSMAIWQEAFSAAFHRMASNSKGELLVISSNPEDKVSLTKYKEKGTKQWHEMYSGRKNAKFDDYKIVIGENNYIVTANDNTGNHFIFNSKGVNTAVLVGSRQSSDLQLFKGRFFIYHEKRKIKGKENHYQKQLTIVDIKTLNKVDYKKPKDALMMDGVKALSRGILVRLVIDNKKNPEAHAWHRLEMIDQNAKLIWSLTIKEAYPQFANGPLEASDELLYIRSLNSILAIDGAGELVKNIPLEAILGPKKRKNKYTSLYGFRHLYTFDAGHLVAFNTQGKKLWRYPIDEILDFGIGPKGNVYLATPRKLVSLEANEKFNLPKCKAAWKAD